MSTSTPQTDLTAAESSITVLQSQLAGVDTSLGNAAKAKTLKAALSSITTGQSRLSTAKGTLADVLLDVQAALTAINTPPTPPAPVVPRPLGIPGNWNIIFDDEFTGTTLDPSKWAPGWWPNAQGLSDPVNTAEIAAYNAANVTVNNGLSLALTHDPITAPGTGTQYQWTGALISSNPNDGRRSGGFEYTYGVFEAKVFLPDDGTGKIADWPSVWATALPAGVYQEDDILEGLGGVAAYHFHDSTEGPGASVTSVKPGWHTVASNWTEAGFEYYYDGELVGTIATPPAAGPMYLILGLTASNPATTVPAVLQVAYARVWQAA